MCSSDLQGPVVGGGQGYKPRKMGTESILKEEQRVQRCGGWRKHGTEARAVRRKTRATAEKGRSTAAPWGQVWALFQEQWRIREDFISKQNY